ncbi:flagellar brake domain-containing protein, partial [Bowmanella dokdonensis]|nr:flagellar brake domain-containing protein [Bowmanella dokdonensis]
LSHVHNGTRIDIQLLDQYDSRFQSELIGYRFGRYLIIRFDEFVIPQSMNCTGLIAVCRFLIEDSLGECFAFKSEIVNTLRRPDKLLFMAFPREIHRRPLRATKRQSLKIPASISLRST